MADVSQASDITNIIIGGVLGGLLTLAGTLGTPYLQHWLNSEAEEKKRQKEKLSSLVQALFEHDLWLEKYKQSQLFKGPDAGPDPFWRVHSIICIDFPRFMPQAKELAYLALKYRTWMHKTKKEHFSTGLFNDDGVDEAYPPYYRKYLTLINDELPRYAESEFK